MRKTSPVALAYVILFGFTVLLAVHVLVQRQHLSQLHAVVQQEEDTRIQKKGDYSQVGGAKAGPSSAPRSEGGSGESEGNASLQEKIELLLNISVPITLGRESLTPKRAAVGFSCGGTHVVKLKGYAELPKRNLSRVLPDLDHFQGLTAKEPQFTSCAIVGNSGTLLENELGEEIDSKDMVIRFNSAPTEGYEQFVGTKTSFRILNRPDAVLEASSSEEVTISTVRDEHQMRVWTRLLLGKVRKGNNHNPELIKTSLVFDPEFLCYCWNWVGKKGHKPSSGLVGIIMAMKTCTPGKIFLYGFESSNYFQETARPHYFDWERPAKGREKVHPFEHELKLQKQLASFGLIAIR